MKRANWKRDSAQRKASKRGLWRTPSDQGIEALARAALERIAAEHAEEAAKGLASEAERLRSRDDLSDQGPEGVEAKDQSREAERDRPDTGELLDQHARDLAVLADRAESERAAAEDQVAELAEKLQDSLVQAQREEGARIRAELAERLDQHATGLAQESAKRHDEAERRMIAAVDAWLQEEAKRLERAVRDAQSAAEQRILQTLDSRLRSEIERLASDAERRLSERAGALETAAEAQAKEVRGELAELAESERRATEGRLARHAEELRSRLAEAQEEAEHEWVQIARRLDKHARDLEERTSAAQAETERRLAETLDERLRQEAERLTREAEGAEPRLEGRAEAESPTTQPDPSNGPLRINQVTVEDLRALKLSLSQARRLIDYRDQVGGFTSLEQLDMLPGLPQEVRADLKRHLSE
jgi:DNA uptake protein ComE-like DNA-binding protein